MLCSGPHTFRYMTSTRRTDHDRVRQQADDPDPRWPLRGDLAYDTATSRTGVVIEVPEDTGPRTVPSGAAGQQPEYAPWADSPDPSPSLQARAERGMARFLGSAAEGELR